MIVIRPIRSNDLAVFAEFSFESLLGMTNLPRDRDQLKEKIALSEKCFQQNIVTSGSEEYYFVLEDLTTGRIGGISGILAQSNLYHYFRIRTVQTKAIHVSAPKDFRILELGRHSTLYSEVCCLYLQPTFRHSGQGRLLSLSRFLFIAAHRQRFKKKIMASMRGYIDQRQISPFWEAIGRHFCELSFVELMAQLDQNHQFFDEFLPKFPLYVSLLPQEAQEAIGRTHDSTKPALNMLLQENFTLRDEIDVLDGGPFLSCPTAKIRSIQSSQMAKIEITSDLLTDEDEFILANESINFRVCFGRIQFRTKDQVTINKDVANALLVKAGDSIRYVTMH